MQAKLTIVACATALLSTVGQGAQAQTSEAVAQKLYDDALALMDAGKYSEACPKFDESLRLDPAQGTQYQLAECYEKIGKIASAWFHFNALVDDATRKKQKERADYSRKRADALAARLPKLMIEVPSDVAALQGLEISQGNTVIGTPLWGRSFPVDPGEHVISAKADQKRAWQETVRVTEGSSQIVRVPMLEDLSQKVVEPGEKSSALGPAGAPPMRDKPSEGYWSGQRIGALVIGGVVVAGLIGGSISGVQAFRQWDSAVSHCQGGDKKKCDSEGISLGEDSSTSATLSTVMFAVAGVGLVASPILWFTAGSGGSSGSSKESAVVLLPSVGVDHVFGTVQVRF